MDWAAFFDKYSSSLFALGGVCIGVIASFVGLITGYFFQKKSDERKRKWELEDRESNRRLEVKDKKIAEAQECLETYMKVTSIIINVELEVMFYKEVEKYKTEFNKILELMNVTTSTLLSMGFLNDPVLPSLEKELRELIFKEHSNAADLMSTVFRKESFDEKAIDARLGEFSGKTGTISGIIQARLDKLAQTIP